MCTRSHPYTHTLCAHAHIGSLHYPLKVGARRNCAACYDKYKKHDARSAKSPWRRALLFVLDEPRSSALVSKLREGGSDSGQLDLRGPLPAPQIVPATGGPKPRPASANQPAGPRWPATHRPWFRHRSAPAFALYVVLMLNIVLSVLVLYLQAILSIVIAVYRHSTFSCSTCRPGRSKYSQKYSRSMRSQS